MTVCFRYLPLYHELSTVSSSQEVFSTQYRDRNLCGCGHTGSNFGTIKVFPGQSKLFRDNQSFSGTIWAKAVFRDPSGTQVRNSGLSRRFRDSWQLCISQVFEKVSRPLKYTIQTFFGHNIIYVWTPTPICLHIRVQGNKYRVGSWSYTVPDI